MLSDNVLREWFSNIYPNSKVLIENLLVSFASWKNDLNMGPILLNFIYLKTYFFVDESTMYIPCDQDKKFAYLPKVLSDNVLREWFSNI